MTPAFRSRKLAARRGAGTGVCSAENHLGVPRTLAPLPERGATSLDPWRPTPPKAMKTRTSRLPSGRRMPSGPTCGPTSARFSTVQAASQSVFSIRDEFLDLRRFNAGGHEAGNIRSCMSSAARLDKLKHLLPSGADMSVGAADRSVRATSGATADWRKTANAKGGETSLELAGETACPTMMRNRGGVHGCHEGLQ
jgi:hypothetical protein